MVTALYGVATEGWMVYVLICIGSLGGISGPATQGLISRRVPADEQGRVQGVLSSLASLATVFAPPIAAWSFSAAIEPGAAVHLPGIAFFEGAFVLLLAMALAARTLRSM
jgi:DHA1 family tetracycline resistance protein-like MFS transporter